MQKTILLFLCLFSFVGGYAKTYDVWKCTFESPHDTIGRHLFIDTIIYTHNMWQIGRPQKNVFDSARTYPNALVTDTLNTYLINDTSVFVLRQWWNGDSIGLNNGPQISFYYKLQSDSGDKIIMEYSVDTGKTWNNVFTSPYFSTNNVLKPGVNTNGWVSFYGTLETSYRTDSMYYRFTFVSDSIDSHEEGWMIDNIELNYWFESYVPGMHNNNRLSIYPNPCTNELYINSKRTATHTPHVSIYDALGRQLYNASLTTDHIPISLPDGTYMLRYTEDDVVTQKMFVVHK